LCGWESLGEVPSEATFSRAFDSSASLHDSQVAIPVLATVPFRSEDDDEDDDD
jgi:hypothetical protein